MDIKELLDNGKNSALFNANKEKAIEDCFKDKQVQEANGIALYGLGSHTERLIEYCKEKYPEIFSKIICLIDKNDTNIGKSMYGYTVYAITDKIVINHIDCIIISSYTYQETIFERIKPIVNSNVSIIKIYNEIKDNDADERIYLHNDKSLNTQINLYNQAAYYAHLNRYFWALAYTLNKQVLDIACGCGYGTDIISKKAKSVLGVDIDNTAIEYAKKYFSSNNVEYLVSSVEEFIVDKKFDVIISFETIEHVCDEDKYFQVIKDHLSPNGVFLVSTPLVEKDGKSKTNQYHLNEYTIARLRETLEHHFKDVIYYRQEQRDKGSITIDDGEMTGFVPEITDVLAVCYNY